MKIVLFSVVCQKNEDPEITCLAYMRRWRYEPSTRACENFIYGGCGGNANNFETVEACEAKCVEREPVREENNNRVSTWRGGYFMLMKCMKRVSVS